MRTGALSSSFVVSWSSSTMDSSRASSSLRDTSLLAWVALREAMRAARGCSGRREGRGGARAHERKEAESENMARQRRAGRGTVHGARRGEGVGTGPGPRARGPRRGCDGGVT